MATAICNLRAGTKKTAMGAANWTMIKAASRFTAYVRGETSVRLTAQ